MNRDDWVTAYLETHGGNEADAYAAWASAPESDPRAGRVPGRYRGSSTYQEGDEFEWAKWGNEALDFFSAFTSGLLGPTSGPRGPNINVAAREKRERKTGFDFKEQWPWLALGGLGIVLLTRR